MNLPGYLGVGFVSLYGIGSSVSPNGVVAPTGFLFSNVDQIWDGDSIVVSVGNNVLYNQNDMVCRLAWDNAIRVLIHKDKIIYTETSVP